MAQHSAQVAARRAARIASGDLCLRPDCANPRSTRGLCKTHYNRTYDPDSHKRSPGDPERAKARQRAKTHRRKTVGRHSDITLDYERALRAKAKRCPLCHVRLTIRPYLPNSKELDHMVPLCIGGTHTIGNVRIICRDCNLRRPKDGSDYAGPVTLWAQDPNAVFTPRHQRPGCGVCGGTLRSGRCWTCLPVIVRGGLTRAAAYERRAHAAAMRRQGAKWQDIADALGYSGTGACYLAVKDHHVAMGARW